MLTEKQAEFNGQVLADLEAGNTKLAQDSSSAYTRTGIQEKSFLGEILPKESVTNADLVPTMGQELVIMYEKEPQSAPARWVPFQTLPNGRYMTQSKYMIPAAKIITDKFEKDLDELRGTKMPIQKLIADDMIRQGVDALDGKFIGLNNQILDDSDSNGIQRVTGKRQIIAFADGINRETWADAKTLMFRGSTFAGMKGMYRLRPACALMSEATAQAWTKLPRNEYGGDGAQETLHNGLTRANWGGVKCIYTLKDDIIPDNWVYFFAAPEFLGHYFELRGWTTYMKQEATVITMWSHWLGGAGIGNIAGVTLAMFNQG